MATSSLPKNPAVREVILFLVLALVGVVALPLAIFYVGDLVFGAYGGDGFGGFYESLLGKLGRADRFAWLLVLSPYIVLQVLRVMALGWRLAGDAKG